MWAAIWGDDRMWKVGDEADDESDRYAKRLKREEASLLALTIRMSDAEGTQHNVELRSNALVKDLKKLIQSASGISNGMLTLMIDEQEDPLADGAVLGAQGLGLESGREVFCVVEVTQAWKLGDQECWEYLGGESRTMQASGGPLSKIFGVLPSFAAEFSGSHTMTVEVRIPVDAGFGFGVAVGICCTREKRLGMSFRDSGVIKGDNTEGGYASGIVNQMGNGPGGCSCGPIWFRQPTDKRNVIKLTYDSTNCEVSYWFNDALVFEGARFQETIYAKMSDDDKFMFYFESEAASTLFTLIDS